MNNQWQLATNSKLTDDFIRLIQSYTGKKNSNYLAHILWQRGIRDEAEIKKFLDINDYQPTSPCDFGQEIKQAIKRLIFARKKAEKIAIWGDFDADGVTATSVLWEGLGQFFMPETQLIYYIPNRFTESHGLNCQGIEKLAQQNITLIVTCDTGSTNVKEIDYAHQLGIDVIITDHHTLPDDRPDVVSILNPRYFADNHPLYHLSGVAVAYKLIEALYLQFPQIPQQPLENLLDLVAIGLVADLVELKGDCRYLAIKGIRQLAKTKRFGVKKLLELCKQTGDRPMDISFGIGPRINAVSRIKGDASFCVELLTTKDEKKASKLALLAEEANFNRKEIQQRVLKQAHKKLKYLDLSTTAVIILLDSQWEAGVLGLVANIIAQEYARPAILLTTHTDTNNNQIIARGSARSIQQIDLYELVASQRHLLTNFGGHPFAAGLALPLENLSLFEEGINQQLRQKLDINLLRPIIEIDLVITVAELGKNLAGELKFLEPYGMGNPQPKLLIKNCWFSDLKNHNLTNSKDKKIKYIKTTFKLWDKTVNQGFNGCWWGHSQNEINPESRYDVIVELDCNFKSEEYEVRIIDLKLAQENDNYRSLNNLEQTIIDARFEPHLIKQIPTNTRQIHHCPLQWHELNQAYLQAQNQQQNLALCYIFNSSENSEQIWLKFLGIVKYLINHNQSINKHQLLTELQISDRSLNYALNILPYFKVEYHEQNEQLNFYQIINNSENNQKDYSNKIKIFFNSLNQEKLQKKYFYQVPISTLKNELD